MSFFLPRTNRKDSSILSIGGVWYVNYAQGSEGVDGGRTRLCSCLPRTPTPVTAEGAGVDGAASDWEGASVLGGLLGECWYREKAKGSLGWRLGGDASGGCFSPSAALSPAVAAVAAVAGSLYFPTTACFWLEPRCAASA